MKLVTDEQLNKDVWDKFIKENASDGGLLQSWQWGEFKKKMGAEIKRIGVIDDQNQLILTSLILKQTFAYLFKIFYVPRGPVITKKLLADSSQQDRRNEEQEKIFRFWLGEINKLAIKEKVLCVRMDPAWATDKVDRAFLSQKDFFKLKRALQPEHTLVLNLNQSLEEILAGMKQKARYNLRLAERKGIVVRISQDTEDLDSFCSLLKKTGGRHEITFYSAGYYQELLKNLGGQVYLVTAKYQNQDISSNLMILFGDTVYYLYGASDYNFRSVMAPYLLHFEAIKKFKELGAKRYDFWGIAGDGESDEREDDWGGFSRFKRGFAPEAPITEYVGTWELPYRQKSYKMLSFLR